MAFIGDSSSSSSSVAHQWAHDVFLSFRGEDTRNNFTAHLYAALDRKGIKTYIDNDLERGENISPALLKAIEESRISVIVLSQNYASSSWCLDELATILECKETKGQVVLPVFYNVDPSEVRHQINNFGEAFAKHEKRFKDDQMKVQRWKTALTQVANLSGCNLGNRNEHDFIQEIIEWVNSMLVKETYFQVAKYPVGIESRVKVVKSLLDIKKKDSTCIVGIVGTGGIGKTTLAKAIYNSIASQFEGSCILENVRETSRQKDGLIHLQNKLLSKILGGSSQMVDNVDQGVTLIEKRLYLKRILLVLDDVDELVQLEMLAEKINWFGLGSKIIITTRNKHLLRAYDGVVSIYPVKELAQYEALRLFSWYAFKSDKPNDGYVEVTKDAICYCGGLPLALTVLGSALKGRDILYWKSKYDEYRRFPNSDIQKILGISFDGLEENAKNIFLDIACFFKGEDVKYVREMLDSCGFHSNTGIDELKDKCLITDDWGSIMMHDLVQEMGKEIVRQESPKNPGKRSRLWFHEDVQRVLEGDMGTNKVEGILIDLPYSRQPIHLSPIAFEKMTSLRLLICRNARFSGEPNFLSNELRVIDWNGYPGESFPPNFCGEKLVKLRMVDSRIKTLEGVECFQSLTTMDFHYCEFLEKIPNISRIPNLELLELYYCKNLVEVHHSIGSLNKLNNLIIVGCSKLRSFPKSFKSRSLEKIAICDLSMLKSFPKMECLEDIYCCDSLKALDWGSMSTLYHLNLSGSGIVTLSRCIESFVGLKLLVLDDCKQLREILGLPPNVEKVRANGCVSLEIFLEGSIKSQLFNTEDPPEPMGVGTEIPAQQSLRRIDLSDSAIVSLPIWFNKFVKLKELHLTNCKKLRQILVLPPNVSEVRAPDCSSLEVFLGEARKSQLFNTFVPPNPLRVGTASSALQPVEQKFQLECSFNSLEFLDLSGSTIVSLPIWFNKFVKLEKLHLNNCKQLRKILVLPPNVREVRAPNCSSLEVFLGEAVRSQFNTFVSPNPLWVGTASSALQPLEQKFQLECSFNSLKYLNLSGSAIVSLPIWFNKFVKLESLLLQNCKQLRKILVLPPNVRKVEAPNCSSLEVFLGEARKFQLFNTFVPPNPLWVGTASSALQPLEQKFQLECSFNSLEWLDLSGSAIVSLPIWFNKFVKLELLLLKNCKQLRKILVLPPNVETVLSENCSSLEVFLGEAGRSQFNTFVPPNPLWVGTASSALQPLEQKFQLECSFNSLKYLNLSGSAIVSLPIWFNKFVKLESLLLQNCKQLREVLELPRNTKYLDFCGCTSLERLPFNNIYDLPELWWICFSYCSEQIGNAVHNHLFSEGHPKVGEFFHFICKYPGNRIPDCFSYCKEVSNTNLCEIDAGPLHFDSKNTTFAFFAVIGWRDDGKDQSTFSVDFKVFNNGQQINVTSIPMENQIARTDQVLLIYDSYHSQLTTNNLRVKFEIERLPPFVFFKSCAFHIIEQGDDYDDDDDDDDDYDDDDDDDDDYDDDDDDDD